MAHLRNFITIVYCPAYTISSIYFGPKNLVLPREAGSSMGHACPALRGAEFSGSALEFGVLNHKSQAPNYK